MTARRDRVPAQRPAREVGDVVEVAVESRPGQPGLAHDQLDRSRKGHSAISRAVLSHTTSRIRLAGVVSAACATAALAFCAPAMADPLTISPTPGTPDASPQTQISLLGVSSRTIESVRVSGSASGPHAGRLRAYRGARGASFVLARPLSAGERVRVRISLTGRRPIACSFTVAHPAAIQPPLNLPITQPAKLQHFVSEPNLVPPRITVRRRSAGLAGDVFLTPLPAPIIHPGSDNAITIKPVGPGGPMIIDGRGRLVWFDQLKPPLVAAALTVARLGRRPVLTWWQGTVTPSAFGQGVGMIADASYRTLRVVHAGNGYSADIHEFVVTPAGTALFVVDSPVLVHLSGTAAGVLSPLLDSIAQEVDIRTGLVLWEWHAYGHIPLADSDVKPADSPAYDAYHINSLQTLRGGHVLISARDTSAIYDIDRATGKIAWTLGGKASSFRIGAGARFHFQHDATLLAPGRISLFDDEAGPPVYARASRGLILSLDRRHRTATVVRQYHRPGPPTLAQSEGSLQTLAGGGAFVGFGATPFISQFSATGRLVFDAALPTDDGTYRAFRLPWAATPRSRPRAVVIHSARGAVSVYASWNGATAVTRWQVLAGPAAGSLQPQVTVPDRGFETPIQLRSAAASFAVRAFGRDGHVIATSKAVR